MTIGEVKNMFKDQYADVKYYRNIFNCTHQIDFNLEHCTGVDAFSMCQPHTRQELIRQQDL